MLDYESYLNQQQQVVEFIQTFDYAESFDEFDIEDLCSLLQEPVRNIHSCVSKGQLKTLCKQLLVENVSLRKLLNK